LGEERNPSQLLARLATQETQNFGPVSQNNSMKRWNFLLMMVSGDNPLLMGVQPTNEWPLSACHFRLAPAEGRGG